MSGAGMQQRPCPTYAPHSCHPSILEVEATRWGVGEHKASLGSTERSCLKTKCSCLLPPVLGALVCHSEPLLFRQGHTLQLHQTTGLRCAQGRPHKASTLTRPAFYNAGWDWTDLTDDPTPHQGWACCWSGELGLTSQVGCVACAWPLREPPPSTRQRGGQGQHGTEIPQDRA